MLYSRVTSIAGGAASSSSNQYNSSSHHYQDTFEIHDDEDDHSNAPSMDNLYEAGMEGSVPPVGSGSVRSLPEVKIDMDPTERLIEAVESLREAIIQNTSMTQRQRSRRKAGAGRVTSGMPSLNRANGMPMLGSKDEKLRVRKEKVGNITYLLLPFLIRQLNIWQQYLLYKYAYYWAHYS